VSKRSGHCGARYAGVQSLPVAACHWFGIAAELPCLVTSKVRPAVCFDGRSVTSWSTVRNSPRVLLLTGPVRRSVCIFKSMCPPRPNFELELGPGHSTESSPVVGLSAPSAFSQFNPHGILLVRALGSDSASAAWCIVPLPVLNCETNTSCAGTHACMRLRAFLLVWQCRCAQRCRAGRAAAAKATVPR
jgi:hypothetical protein